MRVRLLLATAVVLTSGCQAVAPGKPGPSATPGKGRTGVAASARQDPAASATRVVDAAAHAAAGRAAVSASIVGKIRLIANNGAGVVSTGGGAVVSDYGGGVVSNNGGRLVSNNGGSIVGKIRYALGQAAPPAELRLADARIEVLDATGRVLTDAKGQPLGGVSDAEGGFALDMQVPDEGLVLRVRLDPALAGGAGDAALLAMLARGGAPGGKRELTIDTASSLGAGYVLTRFVEGRQAVFDRLPAVEAAALQRDLEAARGGLAGAPVYKADALAAAADGLRAKDAQVAATLERIKAILLAGQAELGRGRLATEVALAAPGPLVGDGAGGLFLAEVGAFRVRRIGADGRIAVYAGNGLKGAPRPTKAEDAFEAIGGIARAPDGTIYVTQSFSHRVRKIAPDGTVTTIAPTGLQQPGPVALGPDGTLYVGERPTRYVNAGRVLAVAPDGAMRELAFDPPIASTSWTGLVTAPDGSLYALDSYSGWLGVHPPGGPWRFIAKLECDRNSGLALGPDGALFVSETQRHRVVRVTPDGQVTPVVGTGEPGQAGDGGPATAARLDLPGGLWCAPDGTLFVSDAAGVVRKVAPDGTITTVAGTLGLVDGDALTVAVNSPGGLAIDPDGALLIAEAGGSTIKRLSGRRLEVLAGTTRGAGGDGGPALSAQLANPAGIGVGGGALFVADVGNLAIRRIDLTAPGRPITTVAARGQAYAPSDRPPGPYVPTRVPMDAPYGVAVGATGQCYWSDPKTNQIMRLRPDGLAEVVAGKHEVMGDEGDGGPARLALLKAPTGLAFDAKGDLYVCDSGNLRVRRIRGGEPDGVIEAFAGRSVLEVVGKVIEANGIPADEGAPALEGALVVPTALCFDRQGGLIVSELGTTLSTFADERLPVASLMKSLPAIGARLRRIGPDGTIRTIAGDGGRLLADLGNDDGILYPLALAIDGEGRLIVADASLNQIKLLPAGSF